MVESGNTERLGEFGEGVRGWVSVIEESGITGRLGECGGIREY